MARIIYFINNNFTFGGTNILSVIPYINTNYNKPYKLNIWSDSDHTVFSYNYTAIIDESWPETEINVTSFTVTSISGLPHLFIPRPFF